MTLIKSTAIVSACTFASRILGYIRDILIAKMLGASWLADAFFVAFRLPNFFRALSGEGALNAAFVPLFNDAMQGDNKQAAKRFFEKAFVGLFVVLTILTLIMEWFMPQIMLALAPGFKDNVAQFELVVLLGRITFPYLVLISLVALMAGVLNSLGRFAVAAFAPSLLNIAMIVMLWFFNDHFENTAHTLAWAVVVAGILQFVWLLVNLAKHGFLPTRFRLQWDDQLRTLGTRMLPGVLGAGVTQLNIWINTIIATLIPSAVSYLYYADRLVQFPLALIGTAMGTVLLPTMARQAKKVSKAKQIETQNRAMASAMFLALPAAVGLALLSAPIISVLFERGAFTSLEVTQTANALTAYAFGLPAFVLIKVLLPNFFAQGDTKTPVKIAGVCLVINVVLNLILMKPFGHVGLAASTAFTAWVNTLLLVIILKGRGCFKVATKEWRYVMRLCCAVSGLAAILVWFGMQVPSLNEGLFFDKMLALIFVISASMAFYMVLARLLHTYSFKMLRKQ